MIANKTKRRGTALTELAIFGAIIISAIGFLVRLSLQSNYNQEIRMAAFRRCLWGAFGDNATWQDAIGTASFIALDRIHPYYGTVTMQTRQPSYASAFCVAGDRLTFSRDATVGDPVGEQQMLIYANDDEIRLTQSQWTGGGSFLQEMITRNLTGVDASTIGSTVITTPGGDLGGGTTP